MTPCIEMECENISRWVPGAAAVFKDREELQRLSYRNLIGWPPKAFQSPGITNTDPSRITWRPHRPTRELVCFFFQRRAGAAGLHGDPARPGWKEENEAGGGDQTSEGAGGWRRRTRRQGGQRKKGGRRRNEAGDDGGPGRSVRPSQGRTQATIAPNHSFVQRIQQWRQRRHRLRQTSKKPTSCQSALLAAQEWKKWNLPAKINVIRW